MVPPLIVETRVYIVLHCSEEGRRVASYFRSASFAQSRSNWSSACSQKQVLSQPKTSLAEYAQTWFPFSTALCEDFRQEGSPLSGGGYGLSPPLRAVEVMDMTPRGGTSCRFWFLNRGCWDHPPTQSSLYKETVRLMWKLSLLGAETSSSTQSTAQLVQFWSSCRPVSLQGWHIPP